MAWHGMAWWNVSCMLALPLLQCDAQAWRGQPPPIMSTARAAVCCAEQVNELVAIHANPNHTSPLPRADFYLATSPDISIFMASGLLVTLDDVGGLRDNVKASLNNVLPWFKVS